MRVCRHTLAGATDTSRPLPGMPESNLRYTSNKGLSHVIVYDGDRPFWSIVMIIASVTSLRSD